MFIRDDINDKKQKKNRTDNFLTMAEMCQIFLTCRYIKDGKGNEFIPLIERGKLHKMPKEVADEMDAIFQLAVKELEKWHQAPEEFMKKLETGEVDPISEFIDTPEMRNALGNVTMRRLTRSEGIRGDEAYAEANKILPEVRDQLHAFLLELLLGTMGKLGSEISKRGVPFDRITEIMNPRIQVIDNRGIAYEANFDEEKLEQLKEDLKGAETQKVKFDPAWG